MEIIKNIGVWILSIVLVVFAPLMYIIGYSMNLTFERR